MAALPEIDPRSLMAALQAAQATGRPQPVLAKGGGVAYYVDQQGDPTDKDGAPLGQPKRVVNAPAKPEPPAPPANSNGEPPALTPYGQSAGAPMFYGNYDPTAAQRPGGTFSTENGALTATPAHAAPAAKKASAAAAQQAAAAHEQSLVDAYNATHPPTWVNGQRLIVETLGPDGTPATWQYAGAKTPGKPDTVVDPYTGLAMDPNKTAFAALDLPQNYGLLAGIKGDDQFRMTNGPVNVMTGTPESNPSTLPATGDHSAVANDVPGSQTQMTIADGLQWMVKLAVQNPEAYKQLVIQLKHAGYSGQSPGDLVDGGGYSELAGLAFVRAMKDLSVQQQSTGVMTPMDQFLAGKMEAAKETAGASYQPVNRQFTDPGTLMATAKTAAEDAIGRNLTPAELAAFEAHFHAQQSGYYDSVDASGKAQKEAAAIGESAPGSSAIAPSADGSANALLQGDQFAGQRAHYGVEQYTQALGQLFNVQ